MLDKYIDDLVEKKKVKLIALYGYTKSISHVQQSLMDDKILQLIDLLKHNDSVITLELGNNNLISRTLFEIAEMLKINKSITTLALSYNNINDLDAIKVLAMSLKCNKTLEKINLNGNMICKGGIKSLVDAYRLSDTILSIEIFDNTETVEDSEDKTKKKTIKKRFNRILNTREMR